MTDEPDLTNTVCDCIRVKVLSSLSHAIVDCNTEARSPSASMARRIHNWALNTTLAFAIA
jgi:hypothetical protein